MKSFDEIKKNCLFIADLCGAYEKACEMVENSYRAKSSELLNESNTELCTLGSDLSSIKCECEAEKEERSKCASHYLALAREAVDSIADGHFQRVKHRRLTENISRTYLPQDFKYMNFAALKALIENSYDKLLKAKSSLESAFAPPLVSSAVGFFVPSFHGKLHSEIVVRHADIVRLAAALNNMSSVKGSVKRAEAAEEELRERITKSTKIKAREIVKGRVIDLEKRRTTFKEVIESHWVKRIFHETDGKHYIGQYHYFSERVGDISDSLSGAARPISSGGFYFPTFADRIDKNILFISDGETRFKNYFTSLALDILENNNGARICMFDLAGIGSAYSALAQLEKASDIKVVSTAPEATEMLSGIERHIANVNAGKTAATDTFLFIENIPENISERDADTLLKIIKNGENCSVYVIGSLLAGEEYSRAFQGLFETICASKRVVEINKCRINIGGGYLYLVTRGNTEERIEKLASALASFKKSRSVIPIRKTFPTVENFQKESSADGIAVPIGIDKKGAPFELVFSMKRPYALVIGDVASGKSSALHAMLLGIMARYTPKEVKFAIGDFKNGCEFTSYAKGDCPFFEAVVSSEDCEPMTSFLRYYVTEINSRQCEFNDVSGQGGAKVRDYETYRSECARLGLEYVPRIILVVDEFQTLFDNGSSGTGALLSEFLQKGRTYGMHIIMASQRAASDSPRSSFSSDLKNRFTTRIVFKCPQQAARTMLSERCADTGRENSGIALAPRLECGHAVVNTYMGQSEEGTSVIQCFFADGEVISEATELFATLNGRRFVEMMDDSYTDLSREDIVGYYMLGKSRRLFNDSAMGYGDCICDDGCVALDANKLRDSILVCGNKQLALSVFSSVMRGVGDAKVNICGSDEPIYKNANYVASVSEIEIPCGDGFTVNLIFSPDRDKSLHQSSGYREIPAAEHFKQILESAKTGRVINIVFCGDLRSLKSSMPYLCDLAPICFVSAASEDNVRAVLGELPQGFGDSRICNSSNIINSYYCNRKSGKKGNFFAFPADILSDTPLS